MATKAERYRAELQRLTHDKPKQSKHPRRSPPADTAKPGVGADKRRAGAGSTAARTRSRRAAGKASVKLEDSATKPSRKSTRRSENHSKPQSNLERKAQRKRRTPSFRAAAAGAKSTKVGGRSR